jgi:hypothetical protein
LGGDLACDEAKGELRLYGRRYTLVDAQALCNHLDSLVGPVIAEVIMDNLESRLGRRDAQRVREEKPKAMMNELIDALEESDRLQGVGFTRVRLPENQSAPIQIEIANPCANGTTGAAKSFLFSWWKGALSILLSREFEVKDTQYDEQQDLMRCELHPRAFK